MSGVLSIGRKLRHLAAIRSVPLGPLLSRAATFPADYHLRAGSSFRPLNVTFDLTFQCNLSCSFCFYGNGNGPAREPDGLGLDLDEIEGIVAEIRGWASSVYLTGGEPLLRDDLAEIVSRVRAAGLVCGVSTNGTLLTAERVRALERAGTSYLIVSPHTHDACRGDGRDIEGIERLGARRSGLRLLLNFVLDGRNSSRLLDTIRLAEAARADAVSVQHLTFLTRDERRSHARVFEAATGARRAPAPVAAPPPPATAEEIGRLIGDCDEARKKSRVPLFFKPDLSDGEIRDWYLGAYRPSGACSFPWTDMRIGPRGIVPFCQFIPVEMGDVLASGVRAVWNGEAYRGLRRAIRRARGTFPACARCCKLYRSP